MSRIGTPHFAAVQDRVRERLARAARLARIRRRLAVRQARDAVKREA